MNMFGPYRFEARGGKTICVEVHVDPQKIAEWLVKKALENKGGIAKACGGAVLVKTDP